MTAEGTSVYKFSMESSGKYPQRKKSNRSARPVPTARNKMMDLLARRDHSEKELRQKLKGKFTSEEIDLAVEYGKQGRWIPDTVETRSVLAEKMAGALHRKGKGIRYINGYLAEKGLPPVAADPMEELEKARALVDNKFSDVETSDRKKAAKQKAKIGNFLMSRGFDMEVVRKVIYEKR